MPSCQHPKSKVLEKRSVANKSISAYRRRECLNPLCLKRWTTYEVAMTRREMLKTVERCNDDREMGLEEAMVSTLMERLCVAHS